MTCALLCRVEWMAPVFMAHPPPFMTPYIYTLYNTLFISHDMRFLCRVEGMALVCIRYTPYMPPYIHSLLDNFLYIEYSDTLIVSSDMRFVVQGGTCGTILQLGTYNKYTLYAILHIHSTQHSCCYMTPYIYTPHSTLFVYDTLHIHSTQHLHAQRMCYVECICRVSYTKRVLCGVYMQGVILYIALLLSRMTCCSLCRVEWMAPVSITYTPYMTPYIYTLHPTYTHYDTPHIHTPYMTPYIYTLFGSLLYNEYYDILIVSNDMRFVVLGGMDGTGMYNNTLYMTPYTYTLRTIPFVSHDVLFVVSGGMDGIGMYNIYTLRDTLHIVYYMMSIITPNYFKRHVLRCGVWDGWQEYAAMGWLPLVGSLKLQVSFAEYRLFYRALLQKRPIILRRLLLVATPYLSEMLVGCHIIHYILHIGVYIGYSNVDTPRVHLYNTIIIHDTPYIPLYPTYRVSIIDYTLHILLYTIILPHIYTYIPLLSYMIPPYNMTANCRQGGTES